jgi:sugar phosphate isomerase/epimerase
VHPRLSVSAVSSWQQSFDDDLAMWARLGVTHVGLSLRKCEAVGLEVAAARVRDAGLRVSNVGECGWVALDDRSGWAAYRARISAALGAFDCVVVVTTGPAGSLAWNDAAAAFGELIGDIAERHRLTVENTSPMRVDLSFVTTLRDTVDLAALCGTGVCVELNSCWMERDVERELARAGAALRHVQLSDWRMGSTSTPDRRVPGDGDIPLAGLLRGLAGVGYQGAVEIEMVGPAIEDEGYERAIKRAVAATDALLRDAFPDGGNEALH